MPAALPSALHTAAHRSVRRVLAPVRSVGSDAAAHDLDTPARRTHGDGRHPDLRWILLHRIEETTRHNGHLDIVRELVDGRVGS